MPVATCAAVRKGLERTFSFYEGRMGPDAGSGLRTGGGIIWQKAPRDMRALPQWREIWTEISLLEGRLLPRCPLPLIPAAEAVLGSFEDDKFEGIGWHTDTDVLNDGVTTELHHLQCSLVLSPPLNRMLRTGISTALNAGTKWQLEQLRKSVLGRFSTVESGKIARGPHARPRAKYTYGSSLRNGKTIRPPTYSEMEAMSEIEIKKSIDRHVAGSLRDVIPCTPSKKANEAFEKSFMKALQDSEVLSMRGPARSHESWRKHAKKFGWRVTVVKLLLQGVAASELGARTAFNDRPVSRAVNVITYSRNCGDPTGIIRWCENGGRKRRKASKTAPVGDAASRHERAKKKASITRGKKLKKRTA